jgi:predicted amino acid dehydrogenase
MVRTIEAANRATGRPLDGENIAFLGVGAIGTATLRLMLHKLGSPRRIVLCDVPAKRTEIEALAKELSDRHRCRIDCITSSGTSAPEAIYHASMIVGATNIPGLIDITRLRPGSVIVDDSFPHCFDLARARERIERTADVLIAAGGRLSMPGTTAWHIAAPPQFAGVVSSALTRDLHSVPGTVTGCILSSLLTQAYGAAATIGPTSLAASRVHWDQLEQLAITAAPLHCGPLLYSAEWLRSFRERLGSNAYVL